MFMGNGEEKLKDHMTVQHPDVPWKPPRKMFKYYNQFYKEMEGIIECLLCDYKTNREMKKSPYDKIRLHVKRNVSQKMRVLKPPSIINAIVKISVVKKFIVKNIKVTK